MFLAHSRAPFQRELVSAVFPGWPAPRWLLQMELCCHLSSGPSSELPGVGPGEQLGDLFPRASRGGAGVCTRMRRRSRCGRGAHARSSWEHTRLRGRTAARALPRLLERNLFPLVNQSMLIKEMGLNIEKHREQEKGTPSPITRSLATLCFCLCTDLFWCFPTLKWLLIH